MNKLVLVAVFLAVVSGNVVIEKLLSQEDPLAVQQFGQFMIKYRKMNTYQSKYEAYARFKVFEQSLARIDRLNAEDNGAVFAVNKFSDLTPQEFKATYTGLKPRTMVMEMHDLVDVKDTPTAWDWRDHGRVTGVKDQGQCGSCWAFGTVAAIEGQYAANDSNRLTAFSEEQLVDCETEDGACEGGLQENAFDYLKTNGFMLEVDYEYTAGRGRKGKCQYDKQNTYGTVKSWKQLSTDEDQIMATLAQEGPLTISVNADYYQDYSSGVLDVNKRRCKGGNDNLDHAVTMVGYGTTDGGKDFWIIKNSWSDGWGEDGYIRMRRGTDCCGLADDVLSVTLN